MQKLLRDLDAAVKAGDWLIARQLLVTGLSEAADLCDQEPDTPERFRQLKAISQELAMHSLQICGALRALGEWTPME